MGNSDMLRVTLTPGRPGEGVLLRSTVVGYDQQD